MTTDEENLVTNNINMAYDLAWKYYKKFQGYIKLEDLQSSCLYGLTKAAKTYDASLNYVFSTYAYQVMKYEIIWDYRRNKKHDANISLNTPVKENSILEDTLSSTYDITDEVNKKLYIDKLHKEINKLYPRYRKILEYKLQGYTLAEIGDILGLSTSQISKGYIEAINILRDKFNVKEDL